MAWDYPPLDPAAGIDNNDAIAARERSRVNECLSDAVKQANQQYAAKIVELYDVLFERLEDDENGETKTFKDKTFTNVSRLQERMEPYQELITEELQAAVADLVRTIDQYDPNDVRANKSERSKMRDALADLQPSLFPYRPLEEPS